MKTSDLATEWSLLQNQFDSYEKLSLLIKLASIGLFTASLLTEKLTIFIAMVLLVLWIQDAIWKTFQARIDHRLLQIEPYLLDDQRPDNQEGKAFQFNSLYLKNRLGGVGLVVEYGRQAIRPTIAFPHVVLLLMSAAKLLAL